MSASEPVACSLSGSDMAERQAELCALFADSVVEKKRDERGLRLLLRDSPGLAERVARVVELERECCPFLQIALEREAGHLDLRIEGPPEAAPVIDGFAQLSAA